MPGPYGVTSTGFNPMTFSDIKAEMEEEARAEWGENVDLTPQSFLGQIIGVQAERYATLWDLAERVYASRDPDQATESALEVVCAITGTVKEPARATSVQGVAIGTNATVLPVGRVASVSGTGERFATTETVTIATLSARTPGAAYAVGDLITGDSGKVYSCTTAITASDTAPTGTGSSIADDDGTWRYCGAGTAAVAVECDAEETGAINALAGTLTTIETPVGGWTSIFNPLDGDLGADVETDAALRVRREDELRAAGTSPVEAIRADLLEVDDVESVTVFENNTDTTDGDGIPPHSVEALVLGGDDTDIFEQLFASTAGGIRTHGTESGSVTDSQGHAHTIEFSRATEVPIYMIVNVTYDATQYPADGDQQVETAILAFGNLSGFGKNAVAASFVAQAFGIDGVIDCQVLIDDAPAPATSTTVAVGLREIATYDSARITVNATPGTP